MARKDATTTNRSGQTTAGADALHVLLRAWQAEGCEQALALLVRMVAPIVEQAARRELRASGIRDPAAADDATARVFDHLRRLHGGAAGERPVTGFADADGPHAGHVDALAFIRLLARSRARDVARSRRRAGRHERPFATLDEAARDRVHAVTASPDDAPQPDLEPRLLAAIAALDGRERTAITLRLEGKSLAVVAHALDVCEGTASRIHARAVATLRAALRPR